MTMSMMMNKRMHVWGAVWPGKQAGDCRPVGERDPHWRKGVSIIMMMMMMMMVMMMMVMMMLMMMISVMMIVIMKLMMMMMLVIFMMHV